MSAEFQIRDLHRELLDREDTIETLRARIRELEAELLGAAHPTPASQGSEPGSVSIACAAPSSFFSKAA